MLYCGPLSGERCRGDWTICGGIGDSVCIFCSVKTEATEGIWQGYDSMYEGIKGQACVWKHIVVLSPDCLSVCLCSAG